MSDITAISNVSSCADGSGFSVSDCCANAPIPFGTTPKTMDAAKDIATSVFLTFLNINSSVSKIYGNYSPSM